MATSQKRESVYDRLPTFNDVDSESSQSKRCEKHLTGQSGHRSQSL